MPSSRTRRRRGVAWFLAAAAVALLVPAGLPARADAASATHATLRWKACGRAQCTTLTLPVDYAQPAAATFPLALARVRASGGAPRLGSLLVNFGGPGEA